METIIHLDQFQEALLEDFHGLPRDPNREDDYFSHLSGLIHLNPSPSSQIAAWEHVLEILKGDASVRYDAMHKGTPYYFLGCAAYFVQDYEKALFYMDCAVEQDLSIHGDRWPNLPSGKFLLLDTESPEQYAWPLVQQISGVFQFATERLRLLGGRQFTLDDYRDNLVRPAIVGDSSLRSVVTAFLTFLLEYNSRKRQLFLAPSTGGTGEPFYLHLFKGALLFETLLKTSSAGHGVLAQNHRATLNNMLSDAVIYGPMGFQVAPQGLGGDTFDEILQLIEDDENNGMDFDLRAIRATWGVRNKTGHSMAWPRRLSVDEYERIFLLILGALSITILTLYP